MYFDNDADWEMMELEAAGDEAARLEKLGICSHGWWSTKPAIKCNHCGLEFASEQELFEAQDNPQDYQMVDTGDGAPQYTFAPTGQLSLL